jgi:chromosome segregation ATPase
MIAFQKSKIATYEVAIQSIQKHSDSLQTRLTSTEKYCKHLDEERHKDLEKIEELKQQINELKQQISILLQENKALKNVVEELQMENDSSQNELEKYRPKYYETLRQLGEVRDKLRLKEAQKENLQTKIELYLKEKESSDTAMWFLHELNAEGGLPSAKDPKVIVNFTQKITQNNKEQGGVFEWLANFFVSCFFKR